MGRKNSSQAMFDLNVGKDRQALGRARAPVRGASAIQATPTFQSGWEENARSGPGIAGTKL